MTLKDILLRLSFTSNLTPMVNFLPDFTTKETTSVLPLQVYIFHTLIVIYQLVYISQLHSSLQFVFKLVTSPYSEY